MKRLNKIVIMTVVAMFLTGTTYNYNETTSRILAINTDVKESNVYRINKKETTTTKTVVKKESTKIEETTKKVTTTTITTKKTVVNGIGKSINGASQEYVNKLNVELNKIPKKLLDIFVSEGWSIYVTGENLAETHFGGKYSSVQGLTNYNEKYILIEARDRAINESTIHEFGHFLDYYLGFESNNNNFKTLYNNEVEIFKSNITNSSCVRSEREYFAEMFYYMNTNSSKCPTATYNYINNIVNNL